MHALDLDFAPPALEHTVQNKGNLKTVHLSPQPKKKKEQKIKKKEASCKTITSRRLKKHFNNVIQIVENSDPFSV